MMVSLWWAVLAFMACNLNSKSLTEMCLVVLESGLLCFFFFIPDNLEHLQGIGCYIRLQPVVRAV